MEGTQKIMILTDEDEARGDNGNEQGGQWGRWE